MLETQKLDWLALPGKDEKYLDAKLTPVLARLKKYLDDYAMLYYMNNIFLLQQ